MLERSRDGENKQDCCDREEGCSGKIKHHVEPLAKEMVSDIGVVHK